MGGSGARGSESFISVQETIKTCSTKKQAHRGGSGTNIDKEAQE